MRLFLTVFFFTAKSQQVLTLDEAIATALNNNYDIKIAKYDSASAAIDASYIYTAFLPQLNGTATRTFTRNKETLRYKTVTRNDTSGISKANNINLGLSLDWTVFDGPKMFATRD